MHLTEDDLVSVITGQWAPSLGFLAELAAPDGDYPLSASVQLSGAWEGRVVVDATEDFATHVAMVMFAQPSNQISHDDRADALRELANQMGGAVKPFAGGDCEMSLPSNEAVPSTNQDGTSVGFTISDHHARIRLLSN